jgi:ferredoxin/flavodoxin
MNTIYWFSGTGNSLYVAKRLSAALNGATLIQITDEAPTGAIGGEGAKVGFVFPSYYGNLPRAVKTFVERLDIKPGTYTFAIVTMGAPFGLGSVASLDKALKDKRCKLDFGRGVLMPANYVISYNPADSSKSEKRLGKTNKNIDKYAEQIKAREQSLKTIPITANNLYKKIESLDAAFIAKESCTGCGLCEKICPVRNIRLKNGKPEWLHRCEHCVACISWCPAKAIDYGNKTVSRRRYRNPLIKVDEMIRK